MAAESNIHPWLKIIRERQTDRASDIKNTEQCLSDGLEELARLHKEASPALKCFSSLFQMHILGQSLGSVINTIDGPLPLGDEVHNPQRMNTAAVRDRQIRMMPSVEDCISDGLEELASVYYKTNEEVAIISRHLGRLFRLLAMSRKLWQDTEREICTILKDPLQTEHREKLQRMLSRYKTADGDAEARSHGYAPQPR